MKRLLIVGAVCLLVTACAVVFDLHQPQTARKVKGWLDENACPHCNFPLTDKGEKEGVRYCLWCKQTSNAP